MKEFIKSCSITELENIKRIIDDELDKKISLSVEHIIKSFIGYNDKKLEQLRHKYCRFQDRSKSNKEYDRIQLYIDCIDKKLGY